ncbi:hypothetical protein [Marinobacter sp.]|uniref:hypothetical protein n=1 Tax=Marinobacter sp. TaxID=50741 RepID=UPI00385037B5
MPDMKSVFRSLMLILALAASPHLSAASLELLCTISADQFPGVEDGLLESKHVLLTGMQGETGGQVTVYEDASFQFRVVTGRSRIQGGEATLMDFYVEARDRENDYSTKAASASYAGGPHHARLEMVTYTPKTDWYEGIVIFKCSDPN